MMYIKYSIGLAVSLFCLSEVSVSGQGFDTFSSESEKAKRELQCQNSKTTPASYGMGALYGCIQGEAQTVKWFINEIPNSNRVENVKLMWNDWFEDKGFGIHADANEAKYALGVLIDMYAPEKRKIIEETFQRKQGITIRSDDFVLKYKYSHGPEINERLIVVTENDNLKTEKIRISGLTDAEKKAESRRMIAELKHIPVAEYKKNLELYEKLAEFNPTVAKYQTKIDFYIAKLKEEQRAKKARYEKRNREHHLVVEGVKWNYHDYEEQMGRGTVKLAYVKSLNDLNFDFPYRGAQKATLTLRNHPKHGRDVILRIEKGQFKCSSYNGCKVAVRFDKGKAQTYNAVGPEDNSSTVIFIRNYKRFVTKAKKSKKVYIEATIYREGDNVMEFNIEDFDL